MKIALPERLDRLGQWYRRENERPLLGFYLDSQYPLHRFRGSSNHLPNGPVSLEDIVVEDYLEDCDRLYGLYEEAGGDLIWSAAPFFGLPWVEALLGCKVIADHGTGSSRSEPPDAFAEKPEIPEFSPENPWVAKLLEFIPALTQRSNGRYPVEATLMRGISDLLSALYGGESFILRMYQKPDEVHRVAQQLTDYWIDFGRCLLDHIPLFHGGTGAFFYSVWCPGKTIWGQEDAVALLSPNLYEEFIHPCVGRIAEAFDSSVMHLHPSRFIPAEYLLRTELSVIELHIDQGGPSAEELCSTHLQILDQKPLISWGDLTEKDLQFVLEHLPYKGLAINMVVNSPGEAHTIWDKASALWSTRI